VNRGRIGLIAVVVLIAAAVVWWFLAMEKKSVAQRWESPEALRNPVLLATRFLGSQGFEVETYGTISRSLNHLGSRDVFVLFGSREGASPEEIDRLFAWVRGGGVLVTDWMAEDSGKSDELEELGKLEGPLSGISLGSFWHDSERVEVSIPSSGHPLSLEAGYFPRLKVDSSVAVPDWMDSTGRLLSLPMERGRILVCGDGAWLRSKLLARYDHAELLLAMARWNAGAAKVVIAQELDVPRWYRWLWTRAWSLVLGILALGILWAWHSVVRRGPIQAPPDPLRRSLREHVEATGHWWWSREDGPEHMVEQVRNRAMERVMLRHPELAHLPLTPRLERIAQLAGMDVSQVSQALNEPIGREPKAFTQMLRTLQQLRGTR